jgi:hypothetical protein
MSNPLPLLTSIAPSILANGQPVTPSPYTIGDQAQVCVISTATTNPTLIDIGDAWSLGR